MMQKKWLVPLSLFILLSFAVAIYIFPRLNEAINESIFAHLTPATVVGKEDPLKYRGDPDSWVVYYKIDNFDFSPPRIRDQIVKAETEKYRRGEFRSTEKSKNWYNRTKIGDKMDVHYKWVGGGEIEILYVLNPRMGEDQR
jgi:hypothetical protein